MKLRIRLLGSLLATVVSLGLSHAPRSWAATAGAEVPWTSYQAEAGRTNGEKLVSRTAGEIANEAIGRAAVKLDTAGEFIEWRVQQPANGIVIRFCVPDAAQGGGSEASVTLLVNDEVRQKVTFSSAHAWLYGTSANPQDNAPSAGPAHAFLDEVRFILGGAPLRAGDTIRLLKQTDDAGAWVIVDQIDLEPVDPPRTAPDGFLAVTDFGAVADDGKDDSASLRACVERARTEKRGVWIPAGTFHQTEPLRVKEVKVRGAGIWHTRLTAIGLPPAKLFPGNVGIRLEGNDCEVGDLAVEGTLRQRGAVIQHGVSGSAQRFLLEDLWIEHTQTGIWIGPATEGTVRRCRLRNTYADGINVNNQSQDVLLEQNHARGNGDDGLALYAGTDKGGAQGTCARVTFRCNTVEAQWWGNGIGVYGGENILVEANLVNSASSGAGILHSTGFESWPSKQVRISGNEVVDCGGKAFSQSWGALQVYLPGRAIEGLLIENNRVLRATSAGVKLFGGKSPIDATLVGNQIEAPGSEGILILDSLRGSVTLKDNRVTKLVPGQSEVLNKASAAQLKLEGLRLGGGVRPERSPGF